MLEVKIEEVQLPTNFKAEIVDSGYSTEFRFNPAIAMPFDQASLLKSKEIQKLISQRKAVPADTFLPLPSWVKMVSAVLRKALPEYLGTDGFWSYSEGNSESFYGSGEKEDWTFSHRSSEGNLEASLNYSVQCADKKFIPVVENETVRAPAIIGGSLEGYVLIKAGIPFPKEGDYKHGDYIYGFETSVPIARALFSKSLIQLGTDGFRFNENQQIRGGYSFSAQVVYVQVQEPTFPRMKKAVELASEVNSFYQEHALELQEVARIVSEVRSFKCKTRDKIVGAHNQFMRDYEQARKEFGIDLVLPQGIGDAVGQIDARIREMLHPAEEKLSRLYSGFPRGLLSYASSEEKKRDSSGSGSLYFR